MNVDFEDFDIFTFLHCSLTYFINALDTFLILNAQFNFKLRITKSKRQETLRVCK